MTMASSSPATWLGRDGFRDPPDGSPQTYRADLPLPATPDQCDRFLDRAERRVRFADIRSDVACELARFLGVASALWTPDRRRRLRFLLVDAGEDAVEAILAEVARSPRPEVSDDAEIALRAIQNRHPAASEKLAARLTSDPHSAVRATLVHVLDEAPGRSAIDALVRALDDPDADVRDAAAQALSRHPGCEVETALKQRLRRERNAIVVDSIQSALEELASA